MKISSIVIFLAIAIFVVSCSDSSDSIGSNPIEDDTSTVNAPPDSSNLNPSMTGSFFYQEDTASATFDILDLASGEVSHFTNLDWGSAFGPADAVRYYPTSVRFKQNSGLLIVAKRLFGDGQNALLVGNSAGTIKSTIPFNLGWELDHEVMLSPDERYAAFAITSPTGSTFVQIVSVEGEFVSGYETHRREIVWFSDGRLLMGGWNRGFEITQPFDAGPGEIIEIGDDKNGVITSFDLSPDESEIAYVLRIPAKQGESAEQYTSQIRLLNIVTKEDRLLATSGRTGSFGRLSSIFWSYDQKWIASYFGEDSRNNRLVAIPANGSELTVYLDRVSNPVSGAHSPEVKVLRHYTLDVAVTRWHFYDYNWIPN